MSNSCKDGCFVEGKYKIRVNVIILKDYKILASFRPTSRSGIILYFDYAVISPDTTL